MTNTVPRGIRNNNPGNIRKGQQWKGLAEEQPDPDFCRFETPEYGIRALARVLRTYQTKYGLNTIRKIIQRWAPPNENDTEAYVASVARHVGVGPDTGISVARTDIMIPLVTAIIRHENGCQPYTADQLLDGIGRA